VTGWLLDTLLATSALILLVLLVREPVRRNFGSRVTYGLWLIPAARLFMPTLTRTVERTIPAQAGFHPPLRYLGGEPLAMAQVAMPEPSLIDQLGGWPSLLLSVWLAVAGGLFLSRLIAFHRDRRAILESSVRTTRVGSIRLVRSPEIVSPVALGIVRPIIAVPATFDALYATRERRLVLEHELAHHRSGDLLANLFAFVLLCLQWFNPLAWAAHAAFRFDQEAACDARVLDKVKAVDRADYGRAIAKAASGRALLFASALDRPTSLQRRLKSMLRTANPARRLTGRLIVLSAIAVALPLTASRAIEYVDVAAPALPSAPAVHETAAVAPVPVVAAAAAPVAASLPVAAAAVIQPSDDLSIDDEWITIDGTRKHWEELTPAEKARVRGAVANARAALERTHIDREKIMRDVAAATDNIRIEELQANIARSQAGAAEALRGIDASAAYLRASGQDPEQVKESVRRALESARAIDVESIKRAVSAVDQRQIAQSLDGAEQSMRKARADLDRIEARMRADQRP
jgi:beta-lactamase regulating signal transducer with metallopeptidase domain